ncbi:MAG TPA: class I SAM-dependent methyltransferase [Actinomycetes bacterium]|nr:class I SAM-dependent methyltransferase [Actinomycetes bacterium]
MPQARPKPPGGLARSVRLVRAFAVEQTEPQRFYSVLAEDSVGTVLAYTDLAGRVVLDVGAGRPEFAAAFEERGARYVAADPERADLRADSRVVLVAARGEALPFADGGVDVCFCSNVFEHVVRPERLGAELVRVTRRGGLVVVAYTNWLSPWGGHETSPWHYLGGERAIRRYERRYGHPPKNRVGETAYRVSVADGIRWARGQDGAELLTARPRYYPAWAAPLVRVPGLREVLTWNLLLVLRRV